MALNTPTVGAIIITTRRSIIAKAKLKFDKFLIPFSSPKTEELIYVTVIINIIKKYKLLLTAKPYK